VIRFSVVVLVAGAAVALLGACDGQSSASGPDLTSVSFDTTGSECLVTNASSTFPAGTAIHAVLTVDPALQPGATVMVTVEKDGTEIVEGRQKIEITEAAPCIYGTLPALETGHYRMSYSITPSEMPPAIGEFDVTP